MNKGNRDMLWWRIVGFTDLLLHDKLDFEKQDFENANCMKEVQMVVVDPHG